MDMFVTVTYQNHKFAREPLVGMACRSVSEENMSRDWSKEV